MIDSTLSLEEYNEFCRSIIEGNILFNLNFSYWQTKFLLVTNITPVKVGDIQTYTVTMLGLEKKDKSFIPLDIRVRLSPNDTKNIPFLKIVGMCKFKLNPEMVDTKVNLGLVTVFSNIDLRQYTKKLSIRKPHESRYESNGGLTIKKSGNH
jgi:hypothetical protein